MSIAAWRNPRAPQALETQTWRDILDELDDTHRACLMMEADLARLRQDRGRLLRQAIRDGHSQTDLARMLGVSKQRVGQLRN
jgi:hypothetical protein